ncbi:MAG: hypothetical protein ACREFQ_22800 [Stellaceae bacterium]
MAGIVRWFAVIGNKIALVFLVLSFLAAVFSDLDRHPLVVVGAYGIAAAATCVATMLARRTFHAGGTSWRRLR